MNKEKVIEALKMIRESCYKTHCNDCPFREVNEDGWALGCNFYNVMMIKDALGPVFQDPFEWRIERLED